MRERTLLTVVLVLWGIVSAGCVSLAGPNDIRRAIATQEDLHLDKQMSVTVGPVGVFLASALAGDYLPIDVNGLDWVSFGEYQMRPNEPSAAPATLRDLDLPGWERVARVCDQTEDVIIMIPEGNGPIRKVLFVMREDRDVTIVRAVGDLETIIERLLESELVDDDIFVFVGGGRGHARKAHASDAAVQRAVASALSELDG